MQINPVLNNEQKTAIALGFFDGVHTGHRAVIARMVAKAKQNALNAAVFTFNKGKSSNNLIYTKDIKHEILNENGVEICFEPDFTEFCGLTPEEFVEQKLCKEYKAAFVCCGWDFRFGKGRLGDSELLKKLCSKRKIEVEILQSELWQGMEISSSAIREYIKNGEMPIANSMLGQPYFVLSEVVHGQGLGRVMGFPTINQKLDESQIKPRQGVYISRCVIGGKAYASATGYGTRPTVRPAGITVEPESTCETFIPHFKGDLYGTKVRVELHKYISESKKFAGKEQLAGAVQDWAKQAEEYFENTTANG